MAQSKMEIRYTGENGVPAQQFREFAQVIPESAVVTVRVEEERDYGRAYGAMKKTTVMTAVWGDL